MAAGIVIVMRIIKTLCWIHLDGILHFYELFLGRYTNTRGGHLGLSSRCERCNLKLTYDNCLFKMNGLFLIYKTLTKY